MAPRGDIPATIEQGLDPKRQDNSAVAFETALTLTGFGKFHWLLVLMSGLVYLASGYQNGLSAYVIPAAQCDLRMTSEDKGLLNAVFLIGGIASAFFWGILADHVGRRSVLVASLLMDSAISVAAAFSPSFKVLAVFRFLNGFVIGAPGSIICTYLGEFIGERQRARCVCCMGFFFTLSWILLPAMAMLVLPLKTAWLPSWRLFTLLAFIPSLLSAVLLAVFFPESPKFLYSQGNETAALKVMASMHKFNYGQAKGSYPVETILPDSTEGAPARRSIILDPAEVASISKATNGKRVEVILAGVWRQATALFKPPNVGATALAAMLMFCNMFGYYGLGLWLPELFDRFEEHYRASNLSVTVCELTRLGGSLNPQPPSFPTSDPIDQFCRNTDVDPAVYINTFIIGIACLVGNVACSLLADKLGLKFLTIVTMSVSSVSAMAIYFLNQSTENLIVSCIFLTFVGAANIVISSAICDLFPTRIRALAVCAAMFAGRTGAVFSNLILGYVLDSLCEVPVFLMAGTLFVGALLGLLLPGKYKFSNKTFPA